MAAKMSELNKLKELHAKLLEGRDSVDNAFNNGLIALKAELLKLQSQFESLNE
jgi:hypothetical protein